VSTTDVNAPDDEQVRAVGQILTDGRGSLPFALLRGEPLVAVAAWAAAEAGIDLLDFNADWEDVRALDRPLVLHDPLCPLTPVAFLRQAVATALSEEVVVVGVHSVTDTVKRVDAGVVGETVDREALWSVTSPVVLPASVVSALEAWPHADDLTALVGRLRSTWQVRFLEAPVLGRRVEDASSLRLLEALAAEPPAGAAQA
jgi:hypothetical protein